MRDQPSRLVSLFCVWGAAGGITKKVKSLPQTNYLMQLRTREDGRGGGGRLKRDGCESRATCFVPHCACTCRACVSEALETRRAVAPVCYGVTV